MKRFKVVYISKSDGDCTSVWTEARNESEALNNIFCEYWDIKEIVYCCEI